MNAGLTRPMVRWINAAFAVVIAACLLVTYWPVLKVFDLSRADIMVQGVWTVGHAKQITVVRPGGVADRAGVRPGDVLEFDPAKDADWILAGYRNMPEGFSASLPVRHADGSRAVVALAPKRVAYLPTLNDRLALLSRLAGVAFATLVGIFMVWARPGLMTWSLLLGTIAALPVRSWVAYYLAFEATGTSGDLLSVLPNLTPAFGIALLPFALCFPRDDLTDWVWWKRTLFLTAILAWIAYAVANAELVPFAQEGPTLTRYLLWVAVSTVAVVLGIAALARTYKRSDVGERARLKWVLLGMSAALAFIMLSVLFISVRSVVPNALSGSPATAAHWVTALCYGIIIPLSLGYAVLRQRVVDVQFAVSRTLVYGAVTTVALVFLTAVHWLLGRMIEQSGLAMGIEGLAAIGLGLVLHRTSHGINLLVDRVLFRRHHQAEERLRRVTAALPYAVTERSIAEALVLEPVRSLDLASAALFYRESPEGPFHRALAYGWSEDHAAALDGDSLLVRYLHAEHEPLSLDNSNLLPAEVPGDAALPVLAVPVVNQHALAAVVLYGAHRNHTLLDPDEAELLQALAKAAATSHQQVRIATLTREVAALTSENSLEKARNAVERTRNDQLEASAAELRTLIKASIARQPDANDISNPA
jgi:hypothetical protein